MKPGGGQPSLLQGHVGTVEQAVMKVPVTQQARQVPQTIKLGQAGDVGIKVGELTEHGKKALKVPFAVGASTACGMGCDDGDSQRKRQAEPQRVGKLIVLACKGVFAPGMSQQGEVKFPELQVKRFKLLVGRVDVLDQIGRASCRERV